MINFLQSNHHHSQSFCKMITNDFFEKILLNIKDKKDEKEIYIYLENNCTLYNIEISDLIKHLIEYIIKNKENMITKEYLNLFTFIIHNITSKSDHIIYFFLRKLRALNKL